ncbi:MAG: PorT family protein [Muribaculaceae bacterium]|nr:PorT family protein [Muribaculaceae bacterium]
MNNFKRAIIAFVAIVAVAATASAQFRIGPRVGIDVNSMRFDKSTFNSDNRAGITAGLQCEFTIPVVNLAFDASVMYTRRNSSAPVSVTNEDGLYKSRDFINIPINFKYKIGLPVVGSIITPYIFTGPDFAFLVSKRAIEDAFKEKKVDVAWNVGLGVQLIKHLQIGASYGFGMTKFVEKKVIGTNPVDIDGRTNYWTITAAWLF